MAMPRNRSNAQRYCVAAITLLAALFVSPAWIPANGPITDDTTPFRVTGISRDPTTGNLTVVYESWSDHLYEVRVKNSLNSPPNSATDPVLETVIGSDGVTSFVDSNAGGTSRRFYYAKRLTFSGDEDGDGLTNLDEFQRGTNINNPDTDGDGLSDGAEVNIYHTDPRNRDTDADGLDDGVEINVYHTDPNKRDSDNDGMSDGYEVAIGLIRLMQETNWPTRTATAFRTFTRLPIVRRRMTYPVSRLAFDRRSDSRGRNRDDQKDYPGGGRRGT